MKNKRLVIDCEEDFHRKVMEYARANNRSTQRLVRHVLLAYMRQNPVVKDGEYEYTEK